MSQGTDVLYYFSLLKKIIILFWLKWTSIYLAVFVQFEYCYILIWLSLCLLFDCKLCFTVAFTFSLKPQRLRGCERGREVEIRMKRERERAKSVDMFSKSANKYKVNVACFAHIHWWWFNITKQCVVMISNLNPQSSHELLCYFTNRIQYVCA